MDHSPLQRSGPPEPLARRWPRIGYFRGPQADGEGAGVELNAWPGDYYTAMRSRPAPYLSASLLSLACLTGCVITDPGDPDPKDDPTTLDDHRALKSFQDCDEMLEFARAHALELSLAGAYDVWDGSTPTGEDDLNDGDAAEGGDGGAESGGDDPGIPDGDEQSGDPDSQTNVQVAGVDEPDIVKVEGQRVVSLARNGLHVVDLGTHSLQGSLDLPELGWNRQMFIAGDRAVIFAETHSEEAPPSIQPHAWLRAAAHRGLPLTQVTEVDLSNPAAPRVVRTAYLQGDLISARRKGMAVQLVTSSPPLVAGLRNWREFIDERAWWELRELAEQGVDVSADLEALEADAKSVARSYNTEVLADTDVGDWLPWSVVDDELSGAATQQAMAQCSDLMRPGTGAGIDQLSVVGFSLDAPLELSGAVSIFASGEMMYASHESLYVATWPWQNWWMGGGIDVLDDAVEGDAGDGVPADPGSDVDVDPADGFRARADDVPQTHIHKFDTRVAGDTRYVASGSVDGHLSSQWAMSEHEGYLRVASTIDGSFDAVGERPSNNVVTVLQPGETDLDTVGRVDGLGLGERIFAVRFMGPTGYVVTFRQVDPLYVIDLKVPTAPTVVGELKIPGFSRYLHPVGDGLLMGVGRTGTNDGQVRGIGLSLFDVSNPAAPTLLQALDTGAEFSPVEQDHHAFFYSPQRSWAIVPMTNYGWNDDDLPDGGDGGEDMDVDPVDPDVTGEGDDDVWEEDIEATANVYAVDRINGITPLAEISHASTDVWQDVGPHRAAIVGEELVTVSEWGLKVSSTTGFEDLAWIEFPWL